MLAASEAGKLSSSTRASASRRSAGSANAEPKTSVSFAIIGILLSLIVTTSIRKWSKVANHPHNLYLEILLDLGLLGLMAILYVYYRHLRGFWQLSHHAEVGPLMQRYFAGAGAAFVGVLVMGVTNGHFMPFPEQTFIWFSLGLLFAHVHLVPRALAAGAGQPRRRGFGMRPAPLDRATGRRPT